MSENNTKHYISHNPGVDKTNYSSGLEIFFQDFTVWLKQEYMNIIDIRYNYICINSSVLDLNKKN